RGRCQIPRMVVLRNPALLPSANQSPGTGDLRTVQRPANQPFQAGWAGGIVIDAFIVDHDREAGAGPVAQRPKEAIFQQPTWASVAVRKGTGTLPATLQPPTNVGGMLFAR